MADIRGVVITPPFEVSPQGGIRISGGLPPPDIRKYLLYWDQIDYPTNNFLHVSEGPEFEFLMRAGAGIRTRVTFKSAVIGGRGEFFLDVQQAAFDIHQTRAPGSWSLAQLSTTPRYAQAQQSVAIEYQLWNMLPVPQEDVPLNDILEFKAKRTAELMALRSYLDDMYQSIVSASDIPRAKVAQLARLEAALQDVDRTLSESGVRKTVTSLRAFISGEFANIASTGLGAAGVAPLIQMSPLIMGVAGAGITFAIRAMMTPRTHANANPLTYVSSAGTNLV